MHKVAPGKLVWYWDGNAQHTAVVVVWGRKAVTVLPTPMSRVRLEKVPHKDIYEVLPWGKGRLKMSFKGWLRLVRAHSATYGCTKQALLALRKLESLK